MKIKIQSLHFTLREELNDFVQEKVKGLSHFYQRIESAEVCLKLDKSDRTENKVCEIHLAVPGNNLFAKKQSETFEAALTETIDALQKQIEKFKTKLQNH